MQNKTNKLIHIAKLITGSKARKETLMLLRQVDNDRYLWFQDDGHGGETETTIDACNIEEAMRLAHREWKQQHFTTIKCGFRYSQTVRDTHGCNAYFYQMVESLKSLTGVYFDDEIGHPCLVQFNSREAKDIWKQLEKEKRL